jgi:putative phage-type endonuclease
MRTIHNFVQDSPEWHAFRASVDGSASEAAAMLGMSPYKSRENLLREKATGITPEIDSATQQRFNDGHKFEAQMRGHAEAYIGQDLYPATISLEIEGLLLSASCDGLTMDEEIAWEHKSLSQRLREHLERGEIPAEHHPQLEQVLLVTGATKILFDASRGQPEVPGVWYESNPELRARIIEGWKQFKADLANYVPEEVKPAAVGEVIKDLPALVVEIAGEVKSSNLAVYRDNAIDFIRNINTNLQTDDDFATAKNVVKFLGDKEKELAVVEKQIIGQAASIDEVTRTIAKLQEEMRTKRLHLDKLIKTEEQNRKSEIIAAVKKEWVEFVSGIEAKLPINIRLNPFQPDFAAAVKSKRTLATYKDAAKTELARAKGEANILHKHIEQNLQMLNELAADYMFLFRDLQALIVKDKEALEAIAKQRISEHKLAEEARIKAEAERITAEAEYKRQLQKAEAEAERIAVEAEKKRQAEEAVQLAQIAAQADCPSSLHERDMQYGNSAQEAPAPAPIERMHIRPSFANRNVRPTDSDIIKVLALHYRVHESKIVEWLLDMDLNGESELLAQNI